MKKHTSTYFWRKDIVAKLMRCDNHISAGWISALTLTFPLIITMELTDWTNSHGCHCLSRTYAEFGPTSVSHSPMSCLCPLTSTGASIPIVIVAKSYWRRSYYMYPHVAQCQFSIYLQIQCTALTSLQVSPTFSAYPRTTI
jgi:hypothetical protein